MTQSTAVVKQIAIWNLCVGVYCRIAKSIGSWDHPIFRTAQVDVIIGWLDLTRNYPITYLIYIKENSGFSSLVLSERMRHLQDNKKRRYKWKIQKKNKKNKGDIQDQRQDNSTLAFIPKQRLNSRSFRRRLPYGTPLKNPTSNAPVRWTIFKKTTNPRWQKSERNGWRAILMWLTPSRKRYDTKEWLCTVAHRLKAVQ